MSRPSSVASSTYPSQPGTPKRQSSLPPHRQLSLPEREHTTTFSHRVRHMFDTNKTANFHATVTIHELGNVPQLAGEFAVSWKFRGRRPKGKTISTQELSSKPSLPNLKIGTMTTLHSNPSSSSIGSTSTGPSPRQSAYPSTNSLPLSGRNAPVVPKSATMPPPPITNIAGPSRSNSTHSETSPPRPKKKASDPTPLKQSILPIDSPVADSPTESGPILELAEASTEPSPEASPELLHPDRARRSTEGPYRSNISRNALSISQPSSASSSASHLSVPIPRPAVRSGTVPSLSSLQDPTASRSDIPFPRPRSTRTPSSSSLRPEVPGNGFAPSFPRRRTSSGPSPRPSVLNLKADVRKGTTPVRPLKAHTCTWDYEIQHTMKIPLGKPIPISGPGNSTPRFKGSAPALGAGPMSESGLRLIIEQLPSKAATAGPKAPTQDKEGLSGVVQAAQIHHHDTHHSEKGRSFAETHKTVFGSVDVDLAAFAGRGRMTRRFLLVGSRTNATIKLSVDMRWVGGEETWAAPPMQEGHHVTGMRDLLGEEVKSDLNLAKTTSNSSSSSSLLSAPEKSTKSSASSIRLAANMSNASLVAPAPQMNYKTYDHHLKPVTPPTQASSASDIFRRHTHHRHRHHHSRHFRNPPAIQQFSMHDLSSDVVVEAIFAPHASKEEGPFTYVPQSSAEPLQSSDAVVETLLRDMQDNEEPPREEPKEVKHGWGLRGMKGRRDKRSLSATVA